MPAFPYLRRWVLLSLTLGVLLVAFPGLGQTAPSVENAAYTIGDGEYARPARNLPQLRRVPPLRMKRPLGTSKGGTRVPMYHVVELGTLGGTFSIGRAINNAGQVVGYSALPGDGVQHAFLWSEGSMQDIGTLGGDSRGYGINASGQVAGIGSLSGAIESSGYHAFLFAGGILQDLGTLGGTCGLAYGINDLGQAAGYADLAGNSSFRAVIYHDGTITDLGTLGRGSQAWGINSAG